MKKLFGFAFAACAVGAAALAILHLAEKCEYFGEDDLPISDEDYVPDDDDYFSSLKDDYSDGTAEYPHGECRTKCGEGWKKLYEESAVNKQADGESAPMQEQKKQRKSKKAKSEADSEFNLDNAKTGEGNT